MHTQQKPSKESNLKLLRCDKESAAELLSHSADVFARDIHDRTPLHIAAFSGASDVALLLCKNKADVHAKDKFGFAQSFACFHVLLTIFEIVRLRSTPLHCAAMQGRKECVRVLLQHGASSVCFNPLVLKKKIASLA